MEKKEILDQTGVTFKGLFLVFKRKCEFTFIEMHIVSSMNLVNVHSTVVTLLSRKWKWKSLRCVWLFVTQWE